MRLRQCTVRCINIQIETSAMGLLDGVVHTSEASMNIPQAQKDVKGFSSKTSRLSELSSFTSAFWSMKAVCCWIMSTGNTWPAGPPFFIIK
jgi:hypothetical protein